MSSRMIAGAMSGTSADGVDVAIVAVEGQGLQMTARLVGHHHEAYVPALRERILAVRLAGGADFGVLAGCGRAITLTYASALFGAADAAKLKPAALSGIAAHGQTLFHRPPDTIQWIDPALLAAETGLPVISDFRRADCAAGGQGAPLVPFADYLLFRDRTSHRAIVNIGGIANVTLLPAGAGLDQVRAFDTGPGVCVSDHLVRTHNPQGPGYDVDGALAVRGHVIVEVVEALSKYPYFQKPPPKSTDGPEMIRAFEQAVAVTGKTYRLEDLLATACHFTALQLHNAAQFGGGESNTQVIVAGGGTRNRRIVDELRARTTFLRRSDELGVPSQAREAMAFALIGAATLDGFPGNVRSCTGATRGVVLGSITPRP